jgi:cell wall-associated NlpC family hydrolase
VGGDQAHSTLQFQVPGHQVPDSHGSAGDSRDLLSTGSAAFDPNAAGALPDASDTYPGDDAGQQAIAAWMARQAHKAGLPAELPLMAALTESGLKNDNYGDRDSLGYFQMRTSVWNQGEYAGFPDHPELQLKWFINQALAVRSKAVADGDTSYGQDKSKWGDWVADVEQPAAEYRGRYQTHLDQADSLLGAGSPAGTAGIVPGQTPTDPSEFTSALEAGAQRTGYSNAGVQALMIADKYIGTPYKWGGDTPQTGFDCSGLVEYSYAQLGIHVPRVAADQFNVGIPVTKEELRPGDIVFFKDSTGYVHHEGIYIGNDMFLHAPHTGDVVKISSLDDPYYAQQFAGGRDVSQLGGPAGDVPPGSLPPADAGAAPPPPVDPATPGTPAPPSGTPTDAPSGTPPTGPDSESGLFGAVGPGSGSGSGGDDPLPGDPGAPTAPSGPPGGSSTVQFFPAVQDPNEST